MVGWTDRETGVAPETVTGAVQRGAPTLQGTRVSVSVPLHREQRERWKMTKGGRGREDALAVTARNDSPGDIRSAFGFDEHRDHTARLDREDRVVEGPE